MNVILEALQKLEGEKKEKAEKSPDALSEMLSAKPEENQTSSVKNIFIAVLAFFVSAGSTWFSLSQFTNIKVPPFPGLARMAKADRSIPSSASAGIPLPSFDAVSVGGEESRVVSLNSDDIILEGDFGQKEAPTAEIKEEKAELPKVPASAKKIAVKPLKKKVENAKPPAKLSSSSYAPSKTASRLVLEGILYHSDIKQRVAMVRVDGGREAGLVKVGEVYGGFKVARIEQASVTILKGEELQVLKVE